MKKMLTALLTAGMLLLSTVPMTGFAEDTMDKNPLVTGIYDPEVYTEIEHDGLYYYLEKDHPDQWHFGNVADKDAESFTIPQEIDGTKVTIDWHVTPVFAECANLKEINIEGGKLHFWETKDGVLFRDGALMYYPRAKEGDYNIPDGIYKIDQRAFRGADKLGKLTVCPGLYDPGDFYQCSITEFDGRGMWGAEHGIVFQECPNLKKVELDGVLTTDLGEFRENSLIFLDLPELESVTFTPEATIKNGVQVENCPKLRELSLAECTGAGSLKVKKCDALESLRFYNGFLGMRDATWYETVVGNIPDYMQTVTIDTCMNLKEIDVLATPYVTSHDWMRIEYCPNLERVTFREMPQSAMLGEEPDEYYKPMNIGSETGQFTVVGRDEHTALKTWCANQGYAFEVLDEAEILGDVNGDAIANASDAALILIAAAGVGAGQDSPLTDNQTIAADVNGDGYVNASDAALIMQYAAAVGAGSFTGDLGDYLKK